MTTYPVIGVGGYKTSGKDEFARFLKPYGYRLRGMSDILDEMLIATDPFVLISVDGEPAGREALERLRNFYTMDTTIITRYSDVRDVMSYEDAKKIREVRRLLQALGTEAGRTLIGPDVWTHGALRSAAQIASANLREGIPTIVTGIRYDNELSMIHGLGGVTVWIDRPEVTTAHGLAILAADPAAVHSSENTLTALDFDYVLTNGGSLDDLRTAAHALADRVYATRDAVNYAKTVDARIKYLVLRGIVDPDLNGKWFDVDAIPKWLGSNLHGYVTIGSDEVMEMEATGRFEMRDDGQLAEVWRPRR